MTLESELIDINLAGSAANTVLAATRALGANWDGAGVDFCLFSKRARRVELCLFDTQESVNDRRIELDRQGDVWHVRVEGMGPGALYGYRVHGPFAPQDGLLFNPSKLLIDPYARAITGEPRPDPSVFGFASDQDPAYSFDSRDSADAMPKGVVVDGTFDWQGVEKPKIPLSDTVLYETHVRGMTRLHPEIEPRLRGTYSGLVQEPILDHLRRLGVSSIQLLPVFQSAPEAHLLVQKKRNYWGYSPVGFFAPNALYATEPNGGQVGEFKSMVRELHRAGFEVILDVVYNHTAEGGLGGPTYGFKGIDNSSYYGLRPGLPSRWIDMTGCGNTLDIGLPAVRQLVLDSLRYWVVEMGVDGFRFDLASTLGRERGVGRESGVRGIGEFRADSEFFRAVAEAPELQGVKWIAEPWDLGPHGYRLGQFPGGWSEWNDRFRDTARRFCCGEASGPVLSELGSRLTGSEDVFGDKESSNEMGPSASINYVISHDGFTLEDWVRYERKHNEANGEDNRDGTSNNLSRNWGHEGPSEDPEILALRNRARRNMMAVLLLSQGVPMLHHGDELGRSQGGNNNPYCQDNEMAWTSWESVDELFMTTVVELIKLRRRYPQLCRDRFLRAFDEGIYRRGDQPLAEWFGLDGIQLSSDDWQRKDLATLVLALPPLRDDPQETLLLAFHGGVEDVEMSWPQPSVLASSTLGTLVSGPWTVQFDSAAVRDGSSWQPLAVDLGSCVLRALSVTVFSSSVRGTG